MPEIQYLPLDVEAMLQARKFSEDQCISCVGLTELCPACQDLKDTRDTAIAYEIVDEGNLQYKYVWSQDESDITAHDWIGSVVKISERTKKYKVRAEMTDTSIREYLVVEDSEDNRAEFLDPISLIADRLFDVETSITVTANETVCDNCHYLHNKAIACPNCN